MNPEEKSPVLMSWNKGFAMGRATITPRYLLLSLRCHPLRPAGTAGVKWVVWCHRVTGDKPDKEEFVWCLAMPFRTETAARMILQEIQVQMEHQRTLSKRSGTAATLLALKESQLRYMAKLYPRTIALFRAAMLQPDTEEGLRLYEELNRAFVEETYARSKILLAQVKERDRLRRMARRFKRMAGRKRKPDPVEYELIAGCFANNYCQMTWPKIREAIRAKTGQQLTLDALKQKWKRLGLPSKRHLGRPKNAANTG